MAEPEPHFEAPRWLQSAGEMTAAGTAVRTLRLGYLGGGRVKTRKTMRIEGQRTRERAQRLAAMQQRTWHDVVRSDAGELSRGRVTRPAQRNKAAAFGKRYIGQ